MSEGNEGTPATDQPATEGSAASFGVVKSADDLKRLMALLLDDILSGKVPATTANAAHKVGTLLLNTAVAQHKYGRGDKGFRLIE